MAKRTTDGGPRVELFPFLSILACVIGTLFLMITGLVLGQVGQKPDDEGLARAREAVELRAKIAAAAGEQQKLARMQAENRRRADEYRSLKEELARLQTVKDPAAVLDAERRRLAAAEAEAQKAVAELLGEFAEYTNRTAMAGTEINRRNAIPLKGLLKIQPTGGGSLGSVRPTFVEAAKDGLILHDRTPVLKIPASKIESDPEVQALAKRLAADSKSILVLLVRSDGVGVYRAARKVAETHKARVGKLPLPGDGGVDLSAFVRK